VKKIISSSLGAIKAILPSKTGKKQSARKTAPAKPLKEVLPAPPSKDEDLEVEEEQDFPTDQGEEKESKGEGESKGKSKGEGQHEQQSSDSKASEEDLMTEEAAPLPVLQQKKRKLSPPEQEITLLIKTPTCPAKCHCLLPPRSQFLLPDPSLLHTPKPVKKRHASNVPQAGLVEITTGDTVKPHKSVTKKEVKCVYSCYSRISGEHEFNLCSVETQESQEYFSALFSQSCIMHVADLDPMWCKCPVEDDISKWLSIHETLQKDVTRLMTSIENNPHAASKL